MFQLFCLAGMIFDSVIALQFLSVGDKANALYYGLLAGLFALGLLPGKEKKDAVHREDETPSDR